MGNGGSRTIVLIAGGLLAATLQVAAQQATESVWKIREASFLYSSSVAIYSCGALQGRVATIMRAVGARDDVAVTVTDCDNVIIPDSSPGTSTGWGRTDASGGWGMQTGSSANRGNNRGNNREQQSHVRVRALMPVPVTPQVLAELDKDKSRRELVSRVTGNPAAMYDDPVAFPAQRQQVTLSRRSIGLEAAECELLDQMSTSIFRKLDIRVVRRNFSCDRDGGSHLPPQLTVEALMWAAPGTRLPQMPPAGDSKDEPSAPAPSDAKPSDPATGTPPG